MTTSLLVLYFQRNEAELEEANLRAQKALAAKTVFLANVSHELRTPLHGIFGMLDLASASRGLSVAIRRYLGLARSSAHTMLELVNDVLELSKVDTGKLTLAHNAFSLRNLVGQTVFAQGPNAYSKGLELLIDIDPGLPDNWLGDSQRLKQVLANLVSNAIKYTRHGEVVVSVWRDESGLTFEVRDTGSGMTPEEKAEVFEPFWRGEEGNPDSEGAGLGLAISHELVRLMGGQLELDTSPGKGSVFSFSLPLERSTGPDEKPARLDGVKVCLAIPQGRTAEILHHILTERGCLIVDIAHRDEAEVTVLDNGNLQETDLSDSSEGLVILTAPGLKPPENLIGELVIKPVLENDLVRAVARAAGKAMPDEEEEPLSLHALQKLTGMRVLAAEDNPVNRTVLREMLEPVCSRLIIAHDGRQALQAFGVEEFDLVLMDLRMPVMDGLSAAKAIRQSEGDSRHVPIIALTAQLTDEEDVFSAGVDYILSKPLDLDALYKALSEALPKRSVPDSEQIAIRSDLLAMQKRSSKASDTVNSLTRQALLQCKSDLGRIQESIDKDELEQVAELAHKLAGSLVLFEAGPALELVRRLEEAAAAGDAALASTTFFRLEKQLAGHQSAISNAS